jgi:MoxR-like ATPase
MTEEIAKEIVGQERVIEEMLIALFSGGHVLLEGVPGLAKTLLIRSLARIMELTFSRIQFTPDLMPSDITGSEILEEDASTRQRGFKFIKGPVFANMVLADDRRRADARVAVALLRPRHPESHRAGRNVPVARGPARSLHVQRHDRLSHVR